MVFRTLLILFLGATPAAAHFGHLGDLAGHSHWVALGATAATILVVLLAKLKDAAEADAEETDIEDSEEVAS